MEVHIWMQFFFFTLLVTFWYILYSSSLLSNEEVRLLITIFILPLTAISKFCQQCLGNLNAQCKDFRAVSGFGLQCTISGTQHIIQAAMTSEMLLNVKNLTVNYINEYGWVNLVMSDVTVETFWFGKVVESSSVKNFMISYWYFRLMMMLWAFLYLGLICLSKSGLPYNDFEKWKWNIYEANAPSPTDWPNWMVVCLKDTKTCSSLVTF